MAATTRFSSLTEIRGQSPPPYAGATRAARSSSGRHRGQRTAQGTRQDPAVISPLALEAVRRIDALFEIERGINGRSTEERKPCARN